MPRKTKRQKKRRSTRESPDVRSRWSPPADRTTQVLVWFSDGPDCPLCDPVSRPSPTARPRRTNLSPDMERAGTGIPARSGRTPECAGVDLGPDHRS